MVNFDEAKHTAVQLWDSLYSKSDGLLWEEKTWVNQCAEWLLKVLNEEAKKTLGDFRLLDYACGNGVYFDYYAKVKVPSGVMSITGADVSCVAIKNARKNYSYITTELKENVFLPHEVGRCDYNVAICWSTLHHMNREVLGRCIKEFFDCLREDGLLIVSGWGRNARRFTDGDGRSPVTQMQCWPIGTIESLLLRFFSIECREHIAHQGEPDDAFEIFVCRKRKLSLLQRYENELVAYLHDVGQDISFFHLYKYQISQDLMSGEMDRSNSFAFYRDENEMVEVFARFVKQLKAGCGNKAFFFTRDIYSMRQKKHLIAFYDKGALGQNLLVEDIGLYTFYNFELPGGYKMPEPLTGDKCPVKYKPIKSMTIEALYDKISNVDLARDYSVEKYTFKDDFAERFYYGLNQDRDIGVYFFVCCSDEERNTSIGDGGLVLYTRKRLSNDVINMIDHLVSKWTGTLTTKSFKEIFKKKAVQSAIGSIMSRNGSHNIGSHVLAALSHNVGTMPDDRVLYQYIQQRMDYIANVTTESPSWSQSTMLVGELMRTFFSQRHLLEHIAESEGLGAWEFQNRNIVYDANQERKLKIYVRKVDRNNDEVIVLHDFIRYECGEYEKKIDLANDIAIAIPGGVAGQHAFFTIIENIIRNAAKHDWSNPPHSTEKFKWIDNDKKYGLPNGNLEIYIDFVDKGNEGAVEFNVWTNMSDVLEDVAANEGIDSENALHKKLAKKLARPFIDASGGLRRENWGLAEMKISAGYLQRRRIAEIGGLETGAGKGAEKKDIIEPSFISVDGINHLVYRFSVPKPKMILFLLNGEKSDEKVIPAEWKERESEFKRHGIYAKTYSEVLEEAKRDKLAFPKLDYEYVIMDDMGETEATWFLPFRVMTIKPTEVDGAKNLVPHIDSEGWQSCVDILKAMLPSGEGGGDSGGLKTTVDKILACWCKFMKSRHMKDGNEPLNLILTVKEDNAGAKSGSGAGKGLVSRGDVVKFVFEEMLHSVIDSFQKCDQLDDKIINALDKLLSRRNRIIKSEKICGDEYGICINSWLKALFADNKGENSDANKVIVERENVNKRINEIESKGDIASAEEKEELRRLDRQLRSLTNIPEPEECKILKPFVGYMEKVCEQMDSVLCKYAENIVSLPKGFGSDENLSCDCECEEWSDAALHFWKGARKVGADKELFDQRELSDGLFEKSEKIKDNDSIEFIRHYNPNTEKMREKRLYAEPLSGSQSYLNTLERCTSADKRMIARLVEAASLRILVIDERVAKFHREHENEIARTYRSMHIYVANDKKVDDDLQLIANPPAEASVEYRAALKKLEEVRWQSPDINPNKYGLIPLSALNIFDGRKVIELADDSSVDGHDDRMAQLAKKFTYKLGKKSTDDKEKIDKKLFDVLIIHQGIIDKWFPGTANDSKRVEKLLKYLRQIFPYVVITTGRGSPANIPDMARMVPFSTIETTLFRKYPEKMLLVDAIMNVLPKGATENV